jgi:predicted DsbA family dithiol-disulfide isomerase
MPMLSLKFRIDPNKKKIAALSDMLADFCALYNAALQQRISAFRPVANARSEVVWGAWTHRKRKQQEGYIGQHLAKVAADKTRATTPSNSRVSS